MQFSILEVIRMTLLSAVTVITPFVILGLLFLPSYSAVTWSLIAVWVIGQFFYSTFLGSRLGHSTDLRQYGPWAGNAFGSFSTHFDRKTDIIRFTVVTGSTDGIGKEYAKQVSTQTVENWCGINWNAFHFQVSCEGIESCSDQSLTRQTADHQNRNR